MSKMLLSMPDTLANRFKAAVPARQRTQFLIKILEKAIDLQEKHLYECAVLVEKDEALNRDMQDWDITLNDGIE